MPRPHQASQSPVQVKKVVSSTPLHSQLYSNTIHKNLQGKTMNIFNERPLTRLTITADFQIITL